MMSTQRCPVRPRSLHRWPSFLLLLLAACCPHLLRATAPQTGNTTTTTAEPFPVSRPVYDIREAGLQTVGRDGPRYPDDGFLTTIRKYRAAYPTTTTTTAPSGGDGSAGQPPHDHCSGGFAVLTMGNQLVMETLMPLLLESLHRIPLPSPATGARAADDLARHTLVVGVNTEAVQACIRLRRRYKNGCLSDSISGLHEGDHAAPGFRFLSYGMAKLKYIVNALSTGADVLYVDADVVFFRNPFPDLLASTADIAVATAPAPCGSQPRKADWAVVDGDDDDAGAAGATHGSAGAGRRALQDGAAGAGGASAVMGYAPGITFYRSTPGVLRCTYSLLLDMLSVALAGPNATVLEQEHFAGFMPTCAEALSFELRELPQQRYPTAACGGEAAAAAAAEAARGGGEAAGAVAVHVSGGVLGTSQQDRLPLMQRLLGVTLGELKQEAGGEGSGAGGEPAGQGGDGGGGGGGGGGVSSEAAAEATLSEFVQV